MSHLIFTNQDLGVLQAHFLTQFKKVIIDLATTNEDVVVALSGGRSIVPFLEELMNHSSVLDKTVWEKLRFFLVDERVVDVDADESNFKLLDQVFFDPLIKMGLLSYHQIYPLNFDKESLVAVVNNYSRQLKKLGGHVHLAILGVGEDGHIASLFPHHPCLKLTNIDFVIVENAPKLPLTRVSMSVGLLKGAMQVFVLFIGEGKKDALLKYLDPKVDYENCPAKIFSARHHSQIFTNIDWMPKVFAEKDIVSGQPG